MTTPGPTDRDKFLDLMRSFGITPEVSDREPTPQTPAHTLVSLCAEHGNVEGYYGFAATFQFTTDGTFQSVHVWE